VTFCRTALQPSATAPCVTRLAGGGLQQPEKAAGRGSGVGGDVSELPLLRGTDAVLGSVVVPFQQTL